MKSRSSVNPKSFLYRNFQGIDRTAADVALENPEAQALVALDNAYCDWQGFITNERPFLPSLEEDGYVGHIRVFSRTPGDIIYSVDNGRSVNVYAANRPSSEALNAFPSGSVITSSIFNRSAIICGGGQLLPIEFNGSEFRRFTSPSVSGASMSAVVADRLCLAGFASKPNTIEISRVNNSQVFRTEEQLNEGSGLRGSFINVDNLVGTAEFITGLCLFEVSKLAVFTTERVLVYQLDQDLTRWALDRNVQVNVGTLAHNTICAAGSDILYCARDGVHALRRSALNGSSMFTLPMSRKVRDLYLSLMNSSIIERVSAVYDKDEGRYHVFFPINSIRSYRLSVSLAPTTNEGQGIDGRWSYSEVGNFNCGEFYQGQFYLGSAGGIYSVGNHDQQVDRGIASVVTPILWHGDIHEPKQSHEFILYAAGRGSVEVIAENQEGRKLSAMTIAVTSPGDALFPGVPLESQYARPFSHNYVGVRFRLNIQSDSQVRIYGIGVRTKEI